MPRAVFCFLVFSVGLLASTDASVLYASAPQHEGQYYRKDAGSSYNYGYNTGEGVAKVEVRRKDGSVVGSYRYFDPNGRQIVRSYVADEKGFRILGNDLPVGPETPAAAVVGAPALTASVEGAHEKVVESAQDPTKRYSTVDIENIASPVVNTVVDPSSRNVVTSFRDDTTFVGADSSNNYYLYPYRYAYDFPAGFAYPTLLTKEVEQPTVVGAARGEQPKVNTIHVGTRKSSVQQKEPFSIVGRRLRPLVKRTFVVGRY